MTSSADFQLSWPEPTNLTSATERNSDLVPRLETTLVFTQDASGRYLSFYWQEADHYEIKAEELVGRWMDDSFGPVAIAPYLGRVRRVLDYLTPERFTYPFRYGDRYFVFDLVVSPVLTLGGTSTTAIVMGRLLSDSVDHQTLTLEEVTDYQAFPPSSDRYQKLLTQIAWNIRRTLDLETIWQQTVDGLGTALNVSRCIICPYKTLVPQIQVVAEYCQKSLPPMLGMELNIADEPYLKQALATLEPIVVEQTQTNSIPLAQEPAQTAPSLAQPPEGLHPVYGSSESQSTVQVFDTQQQSILVVTTCYQDQPNGLIILYQCDALGAAPSERSRGWSEAEISLVRELADQVGTAIAHATLFAEGQTLATELQRVNNDLVQKHRELEEAREQAEEASRLKSEFLANTSHELRTPLNGMIGFLKLVMDGMADDPEEQHEFIEEAYRSAVHLLNIINDILDIAKIEAGKMQLELDPVKLDELMLDVENFTRPLAQQKDLSLQILTPATRDEIILYGNYQRLLQVMLNLVGNAIKFTHEGGITISTEIIKKKVMVQNQELAGVVKVRVADTGIGVSLDKQDKLFQSFSQVDGSHTRPYGGTGLGLAISQKLVEAMGGIVNFYSMGEGLGSTVTFTVPLYQEPVIISTQPTDQIDLLT